MKNYQQNQKITNFKRKNLMNLQCLTKKQSPEYFLLDLSQNFLIYIDELAHFNFHNLVNLNLSINLIISIEPLTRCAMPKLKIILLQGNQINQIEPLKRCNFPELESLMIGLSNKGNNISDIIQLSQGRFPALKELAVDCNEIISCKPLEIYPFNSLTMLYLAKNKIYVVPQTALFNFPNLKTVSFKYNFIRSLGFLLKPKFLDLVYVDLQGNQLLELHQISRCRLKLIRKVVICQNNIYCQEKIMKCDWPNAADFNMFQKLNFRYTDRFFTRLYNKFLAQSTEKC